MWINVEKTNKLKSHVIFAISGWPTIIVDIII